MDTHVTVYSERPELNVVKRKFLLPIEAIRFSDYFVNALVDNEIIIPADASMRDYVLEIVIKFLCFRVEFPEKAEYMDKLALDKTGYDKMAEEDAVVMNALDNFTLQRLMVAADFLQISTLYELVAKTLAKRIAALPLSKQTEVFAFPDHFTEDDKVL